ncbi:MAG: dihydrolipoamide acetyltransferase family protein [Terrimicrobiaceae bacterium]|nr:dihydrolipoamide acetyltransferase family protein [Terrimicrobiaceae bacterium]
MALVPILMPQLGESIAEATIVRILFNEGDTVQADSDILEVETNKAVMGVTAPASGKMGTILAEVGTSYAVGAILGHIEVSEEDARRLGIEDEPVAPRAEKKKSRQETPAQPQTVEPTVKGSLPVPAHAGGASYLSPRMKARMAEFGLRAADLAGIAGSGAGGRVTIEDLERFMAGIERNRTTGASPMRKAVADAMIRSWSRPLATVVRPIQLDNLLKHRKAHPQKPGPALYTLRALAIALGENSTPAGRLIGERIVHPPSVDIGFAVEAEDGVMVPVIRNADQVPLDDLVPRYNRLVELARQRRLPAADTGGSIATVTNYGTFGLTLATPIPLPEQTLLIGMGVGQTVPFWNPAIEEFIPVVEAQFTLSFDHRVLDGGAAGRLLKRVAELLDHPEQL